MDAISPGIPGARPIRPEWQRIKEVAMYKLQMTFQRIVCYLAVISGALSFVYSLGMMTDLYDSLYFTMRNPKNLQQTQVPGSIIYYDMQDFNKLFLYLSIGLILLGAFLFLMQTHARRKYYIGNYVAITAYTAAAVAVGVWSHVAIEAYKTQYLTTVDFERLAKFAKAMKSAYVDSPFWFDVHYVVLAALSLSAVLLVVNMIWKITLMRQERRLIAIGKEAAAV